MRTILALLVIAAASVFPWGVTADEAPISGTVKAVDTVANTLTLQTTAKGKTRDVTIVLKPESKIVKFARPTEPGKDRVHRAAARARRSQARLGGERDR